MSQVQGFGFPKLLTRKMRACVINPIPKSTVYKNKWASQIFRAWQGQRANKICTIEPSGVFKGKDIGLDVQELTESIESQNAKSVNSRTLYNIVCRLKRFSVEKNGEGALNPLAAVSDRRYH